MSVNLDLNDLVMMLFLFLCICIVISAISFALFKIIKGADNSKPLITNRVKIIEKRPTHPVSWYVVETQDGNRIELRCFDKDKIYISAGDSGMMSYRGKTIVDFKRDNN